MPVGSFEKSLAEGLGQITFEDMFCLEFTKQQKA